ncbi:MAG: hypothetical protein FWD13_03520 [Treponema sp.]|nr:hypothetical protein [Treponema sp.]
MNCLFDNNMSPKLAKTLNYLEGDDGIIVEHLNEKFPSNISDVEWIKTLSKEGNWFVITQDNKIRKRNHERIIWQEARIPIIFLQKSWVKQNFWETAWRMIKCWPKLKESISRNRKKESFELTINGKIIEIA